MESHALPQQQPPLPLPESEALLERTRLREQFQHGFKLIPFVKEVLKRFNTDNAPLMAAAMSFFTLITFVPILIVAVSAFSYFMKSTEAQRRVIDMMSGFLPSLQESSSLKNDLFKFLKGLVSNPSKTTAGIVGLLGLVWSSSALFLNLEVALNAILDVKKQRNFIQARLVAIGTMALLGVLLLGSIGITWAVNIIKGFRIPIANHTPGDLPFVFDVIGFLLPILLTFAMYLAIFKIIPNARILNKPVIIGAAFCALFFELAKRGFGWYLGHFGNFDKLYGSLGMIILLVTWILYSFMILMMGAEVADVYSEAVCGVPIAKDEGGRPPQTKSPKAASTQ